MIRNSQSNPATATARHRRSQHSHHDRYHMQQQQQHHDPYVPHNNLTTINGLENIPQQPSQFGGHPASYVPHTNLMTVNGLENIRQPPPQSGGNPTGYVNLMTINGVENITQPSPQSDVNPAGYVPHDLMTFNGLEIIPQQPPQSGGNPAGYVPPNNLMNGGYLEDIFQQQQPQFGGDPANYLDDNFLSAPPDERRLAEPQLLQFGSETACYFAQNDFMNGDNFGDMFLVSTLPHEQPPKEEQSQSGDIGAGAVAQNSLFNGDIFEDIFLESVPPGVRFLPTDEELIEIYLKHKLMYKTLPRGFEKLFLDVQLYDHHPEELIGMHTKLDEHQEEWYFFSPRDRKYPNGTRPRRSAGKGYWKATGKDKPIYLNGANRIGYRKVLDYRVGRYPNGEKTEWKMYEYLTKDQKDNPDTPAEGQNRAMLDEWVLCKIYKNRREAKNNT